MLLPGLALGVILFAIALSAFSLFRVDEGHVAVLTRFGAARHVGGKILRFGPGLHAKAPWDHVIVVPTREQTLSFIGDQHGHRVMAADGTLLRFDCAVRWVPVDAALERLLFDLTTPVDHIKDLFACILRAEVAAFAATPDPNDSDWIRHAGSYATIRRELARLRARIEAACRDRIGIHYGVEFIAVDIVDIIPPEDLADGLNAVIQAEAESAALYFRAQGECQQRSLSARDGVAIARAHAAAAETEIRILGHHLADLARSGTLDDYVARRRDETHAECKTLFLQDAAPSTPA
jgi:regulator of protease activity HflC (stomatin/prohibitin superfamily)